MSLSEYVAYGLAAIALLAVLRILWSTRYAALAEYRRELHEGRELHYKLNNDLQKQVRANERLREAERLLRKVIDEKDREIHAKDNELAALRSNMEHQKAANDRLNEIIGKQEVLIRQLTRDVEMLKDQVTKLNAQLGIL